MARTLVIYGTHKEERSFGRRVKNYTQARFPSYFILYSGLFLPNPGTKGIFFVKNFKSSRNFNNGQTFGTRKRADNEIVQALMLYLPDIAIDLHMTDEQEYRKTELWTIDEKSSRNIVTLACNRWFDHVESGLISLVKAVRTDYDPFYYSEGSPPCLFYCLESYLPDRYTRKNNAASVRLASELIVDMHEGLV